MLRFHFRHWLLRARWLRLALAAVLLTAQQGALVHAVAHAAESGHASDHVVHGYVAQDAHSGDLHGHGGEERSRQLSAQCALDLLFTQILGLAHGHAPVLPAPAGIAARPASTVVLAAGPSAVVPYDAHAPPLLS